MDYFETSERIKSEDRTTIAQLAEYRERRQQQRDRQRSRLETIGIVIVAIAALLVVAWAESKL